MRKELLPLFILTTCASLMSVKAHADAWTLEGIKFTGPVALKEKSKQILREIKSMTSEFAPVSVSDLSIVIERTRKRGALYYPAGTHPTEKGPVIVIDTGLMNGEQWVRLFAHEFFHHVHQLSNPKEEAWIKEGLAQYYEYLRYSTVTYTHLRAALSESNFALEENFSLEERENEKYGNTFLFVHYLHEVCADNSLWKQILKSKFQGEKSIDAALKSAPRPSSCKSAEQVMGGFTLAKATNLLPSGKKLWPGIAPMVASSETAKALGDLDVGERQDFFRELPPYLGLKLPTLEVSFELPTIRSSKLQIWALYRPPMTPQNISTIRDLSSVSAESVLFFKGR